MTTSISFDAATIADAVQKAARVAPTKGPAFDRAAGLVFACDFDNRVITIKASNLDVSYTQRIPYVEATFDKPQLTWRLPSGLVSGAVSTLPLGAGARIDFIDNEDNWVYIKAGQFVGKFARLDEESFPIIEDFDTDEMLPANEFANKAEQVAWAADNDKTSALGGVHIDGTNLVGCDKYSLAIVPCEIPIKEPVTVPLWTLAGLLKSASDVRVKATENKLLLSLDAETRATGSLIEGAFPNYNMLRRTDFLGKITVNKTQFREALNRLITLVRTERQPRLQLTIDAEGMFRQVVLDMDIPQVGRMRDSVEGETDFTSKYDMLFQPNKLLNAVDMARSDQVTLAFGSNDEFSDKKPLLVLDNLGYECYLMSIAKKDV